MQELDPGMDQSERKPLARRRSEFEIAIQILAAIQEEQVLPNYEMRLTRLQARVYLSWNALKKHLVKLESKGLVSNKGRHLTDDGIELLQAYRRELQPVLRKYGY